MTKSTSLYLEAIRFIAAFVVMGSHFSYTTFSGEYINVPFGHESVMVFFVLSGYVIAFVTDQKHNSLEDYSISRLARLYSVVIPALLLTIALDFIGSSINYEVYSEYLPNDFLFIRFFANLFFVNDLWGIRINAFSNGPFWSLGFEFWYYALFGVIFFLKGKLKHFLVILIFIFVGPIVTLYFLIWLIGVAVYYLHKNKNFKIPFSLSIILFFGSIVALYLLKLNGLDKLTNLLVSNIMPGGVFNNKHLYAIEFPSDLVIGVLIGLNILSFKYLSVDNSKIFNVVCGLKIDTVIKIFANFSFSLYLMHFPLLLFFTVILRHDPHSVLKIIILFFATILSTYLLSLVSERKKHVFTKIIKEIFMIGKTGYLKVFYPQKENIHKL